MNIHVDIFILETISMYVKHRQHIFVHSSSRQTQNEVALTMNWCYVQSYVEFYTSYKMHNAVHAMYLYAHSFPLLYPQ